LMLFERFPSYGRHEYVFSAKPKPLSRAILKATHVGSWKRGFRRLAELAESNL
jgi:hypothetical protein